MQLRIILVIALARSGYHAVIHWMCKKTPGMVLFLNNCNHELRGRNKTFYRGSEPIITRIYSFENFDLRGFKDLGMNSRFDQVIIVNRDPYNWIASSLEKGEKVAILNKPFLTNPKVMPYSKWTCSSMSRIDMFNQYMRQCLGEEDLIGEKFYHISYNRWFADEEYRKELCNELDLPYSEGDMDYVPPRGGGSSFDGLNFKNRGSEMDVLGRWEKYKDNKRFSKLLTSKVREYSRKYFNFDPYETK